MSLLPSGVCATPYTPYFQPNLAEGVVYNLPWASEAGVYTATISVPGISATSAVSCATQINTALTTNIVADLNAAWLMGVRVIANVGIKVIIAGLPTNNPANYGISYACTTP
jgi:hypothetical protein